MDMPTDQRIFELPGYRITVVPSGNRRLISEVPLDGFFELDGIFWQKVGAYCECVSDTNTPYPQPPDTAVNVWDLAGMEECWTSFQPHRQRDKLFYDITLRDGTLVEFCWPNGIHWNPLKGDARKPIADYRVVSIRRCVKQF